MIRRILGLPLRLLRRAFGKKPAPPTPPPVARPVPRPVVPSEPRAHDHGHSHDHGGGDDHGHSHDHGRPTPPPEPRAHDHGHSHDHGRAEPPAAPPQDHGHSHDHGAPTAPIVAAAPAADPAASKPASAKATSGKAAKSKPKVNVYAEDTPNPNARKFTCSVRVVEKGSLSFNRAEDAAAHPFAAGLFAVAGVKTVFAVKDFVTVTRNPDADWDTLSPRVIAVLQDTLG